MDGAGQGGRFKCSTSGCDSNPFEFFREEYVPWDKRLEEVTKMALIEFPN